MILKKIFHNTLIVLENDGFKILVARRKKQKSYEKIEPSGYKKSSKKGMALIMVLSTIVFVILIIQETVFDTQVEYRSAIAELNSLRAYYAAKAGME
ncbi:MAG: hypothetical protein OXH36_04885, partial [Bdellovibrionales bacterium]|nr:hypothetical protein [Bdellovibrionales bacterium]